MTSTQLPITQAEPTDQRMGSDSRARASERRLPLKGWFYIGAAVFMILLSIVAFAPALVDHSRRNAPLTVLVGAHGAATGAWLLLFLVQAVLGATRRIAVHRLLGTAAALLAVLVVVLGYLSVIELTRRGFDLSGDLSRAFPPPPTSTADRAVGIFAPLAGLLTFGALVAAGVWNRHNREVHKRLMLLAVVSLAPVPFLHLAGHLGIYWPELVGLFLAIGQAISVLLLFASAIHDKLSRRRIHPVSLWVPVGLLAAPILMNMVVVTSGTWRRIATWLVQ